MVALITLLLIGGPAIALGIWLSLRSRRDPVMLVEPLEIGRVLSGAFSAFTRWRVLLLALVVIGGLRSVEGLVIHMEVPKLIATVPLAQRALYGGLFGAAVGLIGYPVSLIFHLPAAYGLVRTQEGAPDPWRGVVGASVLGWLPMIAVSVVTTIGSALGMIMFVIPAVILVLSWAVVLPVVVVERPGIIAALRRSRALTIGSRGRILLLYLLLGAAIGLIMALLAAAQRIVGAGLPLRLTIQAISGIITSILGVGLQSALYVELRRIRDGLSIPGLAEVFA